MVTVYDADVSADPDSGLCMGAGESYTQNTVVLMDGYAVSRDVFVFALEKLRDLYKNEEFEALRALRKCSIEGVPLPAKVTKGREYCQYAGDEIAKQMAALMEKRQGFF